MRALPSLCALIFALACQGAHAQTPPQGEPPSSPPPKAAPAVKEPAKEPVKEPVKESVKEPVKEPVKESVKEPSKEPAKAVKEAAKEPIKDIRGQTDAWFKDCKQGWDAGTHMSRRDYERTCLRMAQERVKFMRDWEKSSADRAKTK